MTPRQREQKSRCRLYNGLTPSTHLSFDYQLIVNPAYNTDRGPVNVFAGRIHWQF